MAGRKLIIGRCRTACAVTIAASLAIPSVLAFGAGVQAATSDVSEPQQSTDVVDPVAAATDVTVSSEPVESVEVAGRTDVAGGVVSLSPERLVDSRSGVNNVTVDGEFEGVGRVAAGGVLTVDVLGRGGVPADGVSAVVLNVTAVAPSAAGHLSVFPCGSTPQSSSLNYVAGSVVANEVIAKVSSRGRVCVFSFAESHLVVDVVGYIGEATDDSAGGATPPGVVPTFAIPDTAEPGWQIVPGALTFTAPGLERRAQLVHYGSNGQRTGRAVPASAELRVRGAADVELELRPDGTIVGVSGSGTGETVVVVDVEGVTAGPLWVTNARLNDGVIDIHPDDIAFPSTTGTLADAAPFTRDELLATVAHDSSGALDQYSFVMRGPAPAVGSLVASYGELPISGEVVRTETRNGATLVVITHASLFDLFAILNTGMSFDELEALGIDTTVEVEVDDELVAAPTGFRSTERLPEIEAGPCDISGSLTLGEVKLAKNNVATVKRIGRGIDVEIGGSNPSDSINFEFGFMLTVDLTAELKLTPTAIGEISCGVRLADFEPVPPNPISAVVTAGIQVDGAIAAALKASAGPQFEMKPGCKLDAGFRLEFLMIRDVASGAITTRSTSEHLGTKSFEEMCNLNASDVDLFTGMGPALRGEAEVGVSLTATPFTRIGGAFSKAFGKVLQRPDLGKVTAVEMSIGPKLSFGVENTANIFGKPSPQSDTKAEAKAALAIGVTDDLVDSLRTVFQIAIQALPLTIYEAERTLPLIEMPGAGNISLTVDTDDPVVAASPTAEVGVGDIVLVETTMTPSTAVGGNFEPDDVTAYIGSGDSWDELTNGSGNPTFWAVAGLKLSSSFTVDTELCSKFREGEKIRLIGEKEVFTAGPTFPMWAGEFALTCDRLVELAPADPVLNRFHPDATVTMSQYGYEDETWAFEIREPLPDGYTISITPATGTFGEGTLDEPEELELDVHLICPDVDPDELTPIDPIYDVRVDGADTAAMLPSVDCTDEHVDIVEDEVDAGAMFTVETAGSADVQWEATGFVDPDQSGSLEPADELQTFTVRSAADDRVAAVIPARCGGTPGIEALPRETRTATVTAGDRGEDSITVVLSERPGRDPVHKTCKRRPATSRGEPHLGTFDGVGYSPMVVGEYVYAETGDGSTRVVGRFDSYKPSETGLPGWLTVNISLAVEAEGHVIEHHRRPDVRVIIDGVDVPTTSGTYRLTGGVDVTVSGGRLTVATPQLTMESYPGRCLGCGNYEPFFDLSLDVDEATPMRGLFGSNNDDVTDEFLVRDTDEFLTLDVVREHDIDMYRFTDSWRITDLDDSPFTVPHPVFDQPNRPPAASEFLEPFRAEARLLLDQLGARCSSDSADSYTVNVIAMELAIGREPSDLTEFGCSYLIRGAVQVDPFGLGASGSTVVVSSPGFADCEAVVNPSGDYACELLPDLDADDPALPFVVDVAVDGTASSTTVHFDEVAGYARTATEIANLSIGASDTRVLALHGVITEYGEVVRTDETLRVLAEDSSGVTVVDIAQRLQLDPVSGAFPGDDGRVPVVVPPDVDEVIARTQSGAEVSLVGLVPGVNDRSIVLDATPRRLDLTGTMRYNGGEPLELRTFVRQTGPNGNWWARPPIELDSDGSYEHYVYLADDATSASLDTTLGSRRSAPVVLDLPDPATLEYPYAVTYDVVMDAPVLDLVGTFAATGQRVPSRVSFRVDDGVSPFDVNNVPVVDDRFAATVHLASGATDATVTALLGSPNNPEVTVNGLVNGPNDVTFPIDLTAPVVVLSGRVERNGAPYTGSAQINLDPDIGTTVGRNVSVIDGVYEVAVEFGQDVTSVVATAIVGEYQPNYPSTVLSGLVPGINEPTWDFGFEMVDLQISGILLTDGAVPTGSELVAVSGRDAAGNHIDLNSGPTSERTATVTLDENGRFGTTISVPTNVASVAISRVVPEALDRVYVRLTDLTAGPYLVGLDDDYSPTVAEPVGTITRGGQPIDPGTYTVRATGTSQGAFGQRSFTATGNAVVNASGTIFTTSNVVIPRSAELYDIVLEAGPVPSAFRTSSIDPEQIVGGIVPVDFSGELGGEVTVDLTAELVDEGGIVTAATPLVLELLDEQGDVIGDEGATAADDGSGTLRVARLHYPSTVAALRITWDPGGDSDTQTDEFELVAGANTVNFTAAASSVLRATGTMTVNGEPIDQYFGIRVSFITPAGDVEVPADVDRDSITGEYELTAVGPSDSTSARLEFLIGEPGDREPVMLEGLTPGLNTFADVDYDQAETRLQVVGTLTERGAASSQGRLVSMVATDADSNVVATDNVYLAVQPDGSFVRDITLPADATTATFTLSTGGSGNTHAISHTTAAVHGTTTESTWVIVVSSVLLQGTVSNNGTPTPDRRLAFDYVTSDGGNTVESGTFELTTDEHGGYEREIFLPVGADQIVVTPQFPAPAAAIPLVTPGFTDATGTDFDQTTIAPDFTIDGEFFDLTGLDQTPTFAVRAVELAGFDGLTDAGATVTHSRVEPDGSTFVVEGTFTTAADVLVLDVTFPESGVTYNLGFDVAELALPMSLSLYDVFQSGSLDHDESWITLTGTAYSTGTGCPWPEGPLVFDTTLTARHPDGGIRAVTTVVVPDLSDGAFVLTVPLSWPLDSFEIGTGYDSGSYYNAFSIMVGGGTTIAEGHPFDVGDNVFDSEAWVACAM